MSNYKHAWSKDTERLCKEMEDMKTWVGILELKNTLIQIKNSMNGGRPWWSSG